MSETPIPVEGSFESNAVDKLVQTAWDRFAALDEFDNVESEQPGEVHELGVGHDDDQEGDD